MTIRAGVRTSDKELLEKAGQLLGESEEALVDVWLAAHNAEPGRLKTALREIKSIVEETLPDIGERVALEPEAKPAHRGNGFITDAMRYTAGRVDKRKERKKQERAAVKIARARARS